VDVLQRSLLPAILPTMPGVAVAARYRAADTGPRIGGDWYDAFAMPDGRLMLSVGDVVGHGAEAASTMGRLRAALQIYAFEGFSPREMLERLNRHAFETGARDVATMLVLVVDTVSGAGQYASAGHPPPVLREADGNASVLGLPGGPPIGATPRARFVQADIALPLGSTLVLYTDGLVERRGEDLGAGLGRLMNAVAAGPSTTNELADYVLGVCIESPTEDDIAVVVARWPRAVEPLAMTLPAHPRSLRVMRHAVSQWLARAGITVADGSDLLLAVNEAAANAIEHAYGLGDGDVRIDVERRDDDVYVRIRDRGRWRGARSVGGGLGMDLMRRLVDDVDVDVRSGGTSVTLRSRLPSGPPPSR
jgi:anti-sigma regulatory factor (Ser/Thr protein kinase)